MHAHGAAAEINHEDRTMLSKFSTAALAATLSLAASAAMACAGDYAFEPADQK